MRIGFNFHSMDDYISGVEYYSLGLLKNLTDIDKDNQYIVFTNKPNLIHSHVGSPNNLDVKDCGHLKSRYHRILWEHLKLPAIAHKENLDIIHCPHYICPVRGNHPAYVATIHDTIAIDHPNWCKRANAIYYNLLLNKSARKASGIIAVSRFTADRIKANFGLNGSKVNVISPGIDTDIFNTSIDYEKQNQIKAKYHLPDKYLLYSGNIEPKKNILNLLKAFYLLKKNGTNLKLIITGRRNWRSSAVFDYLHNTFTPKEVVLTGYIDRYCMGHVYKMADCLLLPSLCEGFGFPALEAFACGLPVAASRVGILPEIDLSSYALLEPNDPKQMAGAIIKLTTDDDLRERQVNTALKEVSRFNWRECALKTLAFYEKLVANNE